MQPRYDVIIVGGGPAGLSAAIYAGRARFSTLVMEKGFFGGQVITATDIWNYPGFPEGITGEECVSRLESQARKYGAGMENIEALGISKEGDAVIVEADGRPLKSRAVIIATGASVRKLGVKGEDEFAGRGVSYCATCDGALFAGRDVLVMGGGDTAIDDALFLTKYARSVTVVHRRDELRATGFLREKAFSSDKISFIWNSVIAEIAGDKAVEGVVLRDTLTGESRSLPTSGVFISIGRVPSSGFVRGFLDLDDGGYIVTDMRMETSVKGIFAAGDVRSGTWRQVATAIGDGVAAALSAGQYIGTLSPQT